MGRLADAGAGAGADDAGTRPTTVGDSGAAPPADAAGTVPIDAGFSVAKVPELVLWLDGDQGASTNIDGGFLWADRSGHGNDGVSPRAPPTPTTEGFNGHSGFAFDGAMLVEIADTASLRFSADYTVMAVAWSRTPPQLYGALFGKSVQVYPYPGPGMYVNYPPMETKTTTSIGTQVDFTHYVLSTETGVSDGATRIFEMQRAGDTLHIRVNSGEPASLTVPKTDVSAVGGDVYIGGHMIPGQGFYQPYFGAIAEVIAVNGSITQTDYNALHSYLTRKYAIP
jgi:hypothetical protein